MNAHATRRLRRFGGLLCLWLACLAVPSPALAAQPVAVPDALQPWTQWVLASHPDLTCTSGEGGKACVWPGHLELQIREREGTFRLHVWLDAPLQVTLPGGVGAWPQEVSLDDVPVAVTGAERPAAQVPAGDHVLRGKFAFGEPPQSLLIPAELGAVELTLQGARVELPVRDAPDRLLLQQGPQSAAELDSQSAVVLRKLTDGVPLLATTRVVLRVGGRPRELVLGDVLLAGARPTALRSPLPAQWGTDGGLRVYAKPGEHVIEVDSVLTSGQGPLQVPALVGDWWDPVETWVWQPQEAVRGVELSGLTAVDAEQTQIPAEWKGGRTFLAQRGEALQLKELRRGEAEPPPNQLTLHRTWWLQLDGKALTVEDDFSGSLRREWRLDAQPTLAVGRATAGSDSLLITEREGKRGVELREGELKLRAEGVWPDRTGQIAAVGWQTDVQQLSVDLRLPPGWRLWGASGVDQLPSTWLESWNLLDFFFVLMLALACGKLLGWPWALVAGTGLALCHGEIDAPEVVWLLLIGTTGLSSFLPEGKLRRLTGWGHVALLLALVTVWLPFATSQIRGGIYPQTADSGGSFSLIREAEEVAFKSAMAPNAAPVDQIAPSAPPTEPEATGAAEAKADEYQVQQQVVSKVSLLRKNARQVQRVDPAAVVQTGPGLPSWQWQSLRLGWSGPVHRDQSVELYLLSPAMNLLLAILRVLLTAALALRLANLSRLRQRLRALAPTGTSLVAVLLLGWMVTPAPAQAGELPDATLLQELEQRLLAADACRGPCATVSQLALSAQGRELSLQMQVAAQRPAAVVLPGLLNQLGLQSIQLNGVSTVALRRTEAGQLAVRVPAGVHTLSAVLRLPARAVVDLAVAAETRPQHVTFRSTDWRLDGLDRNGVPSGALQLSREAAGLAADATAATASGVDAELPPWFEVERKLELALPWRVITTVRRSRSARPELLQLPLLAGESLLTPDVRVNDQAGKRSAEVQFGRDELEVTFESELPTPATETTLHLQAAQGVPLTERWVVDCAQLWHCDWKGLDPIHQADPSSHNLLPVWLPWPGETLALRAMRPRGASGQSVTTSSVVLSLTPGERLLQAELTLLIRASQGGWRTVGLPAGAEVQEVRVGGSQRVVHPKDGKLQIPLVPGEQEVVIRWQQPWQFALWQEAPRVELGGGAANVRVQWAVPASRWLLWARGPDWGPAILFWSRLLLAILAAVGLGLLRLRPLLRRQWLWLTLGLLPLPVPLALLVVGWFAVLAWREDYGKQALWPAWRHDLLQLFLVGWTLVFLGTLYGALHTNLVIGVDMQVAGGGSSNQSLQWYLDRVDAATPTPGYLSVPLWVWRGLMLAWALWLVQRLLRWMPWALQAWLSGAVWLPLRGAKPRSVAGASEPAGTVSVVAASESTPAAEGDTPLG